MSLEADVIIGCFLRHMREGDMDDDIDRVASFEL